MSNQIRLTGMATGMDTDTTVKQLMKPYQTRLDKMKQNQQIVQWKQDLFREILGSINTFKSSYLELTRPEKNMLSRNAYAGFDIAITDSVTGNSSAAVSISAGAGSLAGNYNVNTTSIAKAASTVSTDKVQTLAAADATSSTLLSSIGITANTFKITYNNGSGAKSVDVAFDPATTTLANLASKINTATSNGVVARFSDLTGKFTIQSAETGSGTSVSIDNANVIDKLKLANVAGTDLITQITAPGEAAVTVTRSTNAFSIDGISYRFNNVSNVNATLTTNVQKPFDKIKEFIDKYNELIDNMNDKISEKAQRTYLPLTEDQKKAMNEDEIKTWETKAKQGLLRNDSMISNMLTAMRGAFYQAVEGAGVSLSEIGLSTSSDVSERGKIIIDETKLKSALQTKGEQITNLFTKISTSKPNYDPDYSLADKTIRNNEQGIFQRINDIILDYTRRTRNDSGKKGFFIEKAGIKGDLSEYKNVLTKDLLDKQKYIDAMIEKMSDKENRYYSQFAKLESAMNKLNSQSNWLSQQLGAGN